MGFSSYKSLGAQNYNISNLKMFDSGIKNPSSELGYKYNIINSNSLFLYYPFDVGSTSGGSVANYATGTGNFDAVVAGTTSVGNNVLNTTYNPTPNGMTINRVIPCNTSSGMSISFWFKVSPIPQSDYYFLFTIQTKGGTRWYLTIDPANRINVNDRAIGFTVSVNTLYHCVVIVEPNNNKGIIYMNNVAFPLFMSYPGFNNESGSNSIANNPFGHGVVGSLDEFRLYNRILTPPQIETLYNSGSSI
jgi:hypothetical protein